MRTRSFRLLPAVLAACGLVAALAAPGAGAQTLYLKNGKVYPNAAAKREGANLTAQVDLGGGAGTGSIGIPVSEIARIEFTPPPADLVQARALLEKGDADGAVKVLESLVSDQLPFKDIPGSLWPEATALKATALARLKRIPEAEELLRQAAAAATDPGALLTVRLLQARLLFDKADYAGAAALGDAILQDNSTPEADCRAWLLKGDAFLGQGDFEASILAYLHVPVFYADQAAFLPAALLGAAKGMVNLGDFKHASSTLSDLVARCPDSPEAAAAKRELARVQALMKEKP